MTAFLSALPPTTGVGDISAPLAELNGFVTQLSADAVTQSAGHRTKKAATQRKTSLRQTVRVHHSSPSPRWRRRCSNIPGGYDRAPLMPAKGGLSEVLVADAGAMGVAVQPCAPLFIQNCLPTNFTVRLTAVAHELQASVATQAQRNGQSVGAPAWVKARLTRGHAIVKLLDAIVTPALAQDPAELNAWRLAKGTTGAVVATVPANAMPVPAPVSGRTASSGSGDYTD